MSDSTDGAAGYSRDPFVAEFYDCLYPMRDRKDIGFWTGMARESGGPVLELGCGTGRVLVPTARDGIDIVGLDLAEPMLALCRRKLEEEPAEVRERAHLVLADMREFELGNEFPLITTPFRSFQHLTTVQEQLSCLSRVHRHLAGDGRFVLDVFNPSLEFLADEGAYQERDSGSQFTMPDGRKVSVRERIQRRDHFNQIQYCEMIYYVQHRDGSEERLVNEFSMRHFFRFEAEHLLTRCGFELETVYSDYDRSPFEAKCRELILVARKK